MYIYKIFKNVKFAANVQNENDNKRTNPEDEYINNKHILNIIINDSY